jgi:quercetin dioxygenase-like cupin family protein
MLQKANFFLGGKQEYDNFNGKVHVNRVYDEESTRDLKVYFVIFYDGAKTRLHYHDSDQVLIAKEGEGVAIEIETKYRTIIKEGESVLIPTGKLHWHGAMEASEKFSHTDLPE